MKISNKSGARFNAFAGLALIVAVGGFLYLRLPGTLGRTVSPLETLLPVVFALSGLLFAARAATFAQHEWIVGDIYLRIRAKNAAVVLVYPNQIETLERQTHKLGGDSDNGLPCVSLIVELTDGRVFESPRMFDDSQINRAWRKFEALMEIR